jgi:hypothetical protein
MLRFFILAITGITLSSLFFNCRKCSCSFGVFSITYIGFLKEETDTLIIRRYIKGLNYANLKDTILITTANSNYTYLSDTTDIFINPSLFEITSLYDYEFVLPGANKLSRLNEIDEKGHMENCSTRNLHGCRNIIVSFKLDGQVVYPKPESVGTVPLYIRS